MESSTYLHPIHAAALNTSDAKTMRLDGSAMYRFSGTALTSVVSLIVSWSLLNIASAAMAAIQLGDNGTAVSALQTQLQGVGCFNGAVDGMFGSRTEQAVKCLQSRRGLTADGIVGTQTQAALTGATTVTTQAAAPVVVGKLLRPSDKGDEVYRLQARLAELNYFDTPSTGYFGELTTGAVQRFQRDRGLTADGIVGTQTNQALGLGSVATAPLAIPPIAVGSEVVINQRSLRPGSSGVEVEVLQNRLKALGFFSSAATGYYGILTQAAVTRYQQSRGLAATGTADSQTLGSISAVAGQLTSKRYIVVIPQENVNTLAEVKKLVSIALPEKSRLGEFVNAGTFFDRDSADRQSNFLRGRGLDARVAYR